MSVDCPVMSSRLSRVTAGSLRAVSRTQCNTRGPDPTGTKPLIDIVGLPRALGLCLTSRTVGAAEAAALRLAELVVPGPELDAAVGDLMAALLAVEPAVARATKELLQQAPGHTLEQQSAAERRAQAALQRSRLGVLS